MFVFSALFLISGSARLPNQPGIQANPLAERSGRIRSVIEKGVIRIGVQEDYQPFHIKKARKGFPGIDVELAQLLADFLEVKVELVFLPLPELLKAVNSGWIDISLGGISSNLERARLVHFSNPYLIMTPAGLLSRRVLPPESASVDFPAQRFEGLSDLVHLNHLRIGVKSQTTNAVILTSDPVFARHEIVQFESRIDAFDALISHKIDVLAGDDVYIKAQILKKPSLKSQFIPLLKTLREEHVSVVIPTDDSELFNIVNFFVKEIHRTGQMQEITRKYLSSSDWLPEE